LGFGVYILGSRVQGPGREDHNLSDKANVVDRTPPHAKVGKKRVHLSAGDADSALRKYALEVLELNLSPPSALDERKGREETVEAVCAPRRALAAKTVKEVLEDRADAVGGSLHLCCECLVVDPPAV